MLLRSRTTVVLSVAVLSLGLAACGGSADPEPGGASAAPSPADAADAASADATDASADSSADSAADSSAGWEPVTVEHALGTTTIEERPERVATVQWANHEVPLALGVVPVGMAAANFGDDDGDGLLPWVSERLEELDADVPVLFDETDGIDFEAVADTDPDVILAGYSGLTQADYDTLSAIAPVVAYPEAPWATPWRETIEVNAAGMGMAEEGAALVAQIEDDITAAVAEHPELEGTSAMFLTHVDTTDLAEVSFYTPYDTRAAFFADLGLTTPASVEAASTDPTQFSGTVSAEQVDLFDDVDLVVTYGDEALVEALQGDPLLSQMPAVRDDALVLLPSTPLGTAANPTPLAISWVLEDYVGMLADAVSGAR